MGLPGMFAECAEAYYVNTSIFRDIFRNYNHKFNDHYSCLQQNVPYSDFFRLSSVQVYHRSLSLHDFMSQLAPTHWPVGNRTGYCYAPSTLGDKNEEDCEMKYGNPFGPFWDEFSVEFDASEFTRMTYRINQESILNRWIERCGWYY